MDYETFTALHPDLEVQRERLGFMHITARPGSTRNVANTFVYLTSMGETGEADAGRPAIGVSAQGVGRDDITYLRIPCDDPSAVVTSGQVDLDPAEVVQMVREGMEVFAGYYSLSEEDRLRADSTPRRVSDFLESSESTREALEQSGLHVGDLPATFDVYPVWQAAFPAQ